MNISSTVRFDKNWEFENGEKKSGFWHSKKWLKLVILEKKSPVAGNIDYVKYLSIQKVNQILQ